MDTNEKSNQAKEEIIAQVAQEQAKKGLWVTPMTVGDVLRCWYHRYDITQEEIEAWLEWDNERLISLKLEKERMGLQGWEAQRDKLYRKFVKQYAKYYACLEGINTPEYEVAASLIHLCTPERKCTKDEVIQGIRGKIQYWEIITPESEEKIPHKNQTISLYTQVLEELNEE